MAFNPVDFLDKPFTRSQVAALKRADIEDLVKFLELEDSIPVASLLKPALVKQLNSCLFELDFSLQKRKN